MFNTPLLGLLPLECGFEEAISFFHGKFVSSYQHHREQISGDKWASGLDRTMLHKPSSEILMVLSVPVHRLMNYYVIHQLCRKLSKDDKL